MGTYVKDSVDKLRSLFREPFALFAIATTIAIILTVISEWFCDDDTFCSNILNKLSEAFTFIAAASLTGAVYVLLNEQKAQAKSAGPKQEFKINGDTYELKSFYVPKE